MSPNIEKHPIPPFFPRDAQVLFLGSFPPPQNRWCMHFFYPNLQNDFWRILGIIFFGDKNHFLSPRLTDGKMIFDKARIETFLRAHKIALFDTAIEVIREKGNASDAFLTIITPLDLKTVLTAELPECRTIITTGEKATETLLNLLETQGVEGPLPKPAVGGEITVTFAGRTLTILRLPSSSRAYPMKIEEKAEIYRRFLRFLPSKNIK